MPSAPSARRSISLVVVLPALPVTATILGVGTRARGDGEVFKTALGVGDGQERGAAADAGRLRG